MRNTLLRTERLRRGWTQQQLADFAGLSLSTVERAEKGESIRVDCIQRLCECLSKTSEELGLLKIDEKIGESNHHMKQPSCKLHGKRWTGMGEASIYHNIFALISFRSPRSFLKSYR